MTVRRFEPILPRTCGIVFMGVPHCGSDAARLGAILVDIASAARKSFFMGGYRSDLIKSLKSNSAEFAEISERFAHSDFPPGFSILSCYEMRETNPAGKIVRYPSPCLRRNSHRLQIVSKSSARVGFHGDLETMIPFLNADHHDVCKFRSPVDGEYKEVIKVMREMIAARQTKKPAEGEVLAYFSASRNTNQTKPPRASSERESLR